jgi:hypothetical protein
MPPRERRKALEGEELKQNFSPEEQQLVRGSFPRMQNLN